MEIELAYGPLRIWHWPSPFGCTTGQLIYETGKIGDDRICKVEVDAEKFLDWLSKVQYTDNAWMTFNSRWMSSESENLLPGDSLRWCPRCLLDIKYSLNYLTKDKRTLQVQVPGIGLLTLTPRR